MTNCSCVMWKKLEKELLCFGYAHHNAQRIPSDIISSICKWFDTTIYWTLDNDEMNEFWKSSNHDVIHGPLFTIKEIIFELTLCPQGWTPDLSGIVMFYLEIKLFPVHIKEATVSFTLFCQDINYYFMRSKVYKADELHAHGWASYAMHFRDCENMRKYNKDIQLKFGCIVDIVHVEYNDKTAHYITAVPCIKSTKHEWNVDCAKFKQDTFRTHENGGTYYSEMFNNNCWCLVLKPSGAGKYAEYDANLDYAHIGLRLLRLPFGAHSVDVEYQFIVKWQTSKHQHTECVLPNKKANCTISGACVFHAIDSNDATLGTSMLTKLSKLSILAYVNVC